MAGKGLRLTWQPTTVGGIKSESMTLWTSVINGSVRLNHIFLKSTLAGTQFNFKITSPTGNVIYHREDVVGELSEEKSLIMRGLYTLTIENCNPDDTFSGEFMCKDEKDK
jgi:hypothetical protein